jgi:hypothetical protein
MMTIDSTPEFASSVYERMDRTLAAVRQQLNRPLGLANKVLLSHLDDPSTCGASRTRATMLTWGNRLYSIPPSACTGWTGGSCGRGLEASAGTAPLADRRIKPRALA